MAVLADLTLSSDSRTTAGVLFLTLVAVEYGGLFMLRLVRGRRPATPFQRSFARAGHAHARVLVILALVGQVLADAAALDGVDDFLARTGIWVAAVLFPPGSSCRRPGAAGTSPIASSSSSMQVSCPSPLGSSHSGSGFSPRSAQPAGERTEDRDGARGQERHRLRRRRRSRGVRLPGRSRASAKVFPRRSRSCSARGRCRRDHRGGRSSRGSECRCSRRGGREPARRHRRRERGQHRRLFRRHLAGRRTGDAAARDAALGLQSSDHHRHEKRTCRRRGRRRATCSIAARV
jgi:hypothetical protein